MRPIGSASTIRRWKAACPCWPMRWPRSTAPSLTRIPAGDHSIFVGQVNEIAVQEGTPLLYFRGRYGMAESGKNES